MDKQIVVDENCLLFLDEELIYSFICFRIFFSCCVAGSPVVCLWLPARDDEDERSSSRRPPILISYCMSSWPPGDGALLCVVSDLLMTC